MRTKNKLVYGVGINDYEGVTYVRAVMPKSYSTWIGMIKRCYSDKFQQTRPTYIGCSVCEEWLSFSNFKKWFDDNYVEEFALDKDILVEGNKLYSPDTCRFVPQYLNQLLNDCGNARGEMPQGVIERKPEVGNARVNSSYQARCNNGYGKSISKSFKGLEDAVKWYATTKKRIVKEQAQRAFLENAIKTDIYLALVRREWHT